MRHALRSLCGIGQTSADLEFANNYQKYVSDMPTEYLLAVHEMIETASALYAKGMGIITPRIDALENVLAVVESIDPEWIPGPNLAHGRAAYLTFISNTGQIKKWLDGHDIEIMSSASRRELARRGIQFKMTVPSFNPSTKIVSPVISATMADGDAGITKSIYVNRYNTGIRSDSDRITSLFSEIHSLTVSPPALGILGNIQSEIAKEGAKRLGILGMIMVAHPIAGSIGIGILLVTGYALIVKFLSDIGVTSSSGISDSAVDAVNAGLIHDIVNEQLPIIEQKIKDGEMTIQEGIDAKKALLLSIRTANEGINPQEKNWLAELFIDPLKDVLGIGIAILAVWHLGPPLFRMIGDVLKNVFVEREKTRRGKIKLPERGPGRPHWGVYEDGSLVRSFAKRDKAEEYASRAGYSASSVKRISS